jgi:hypothetical protein
VNEITELPADLWQLSALRQLLVGYNKLTWIPLPPEESQWELEEIFAAGNPLLTQLNIQGNG